MLSLFLWRARSDGHISSPVCIWPSSPVFLVPKEFGFVHLFVATHNTVTLGRKLGLGILERPSRPTSAMLRQQSDTAECRWQSHSVIEPKPVGSCAGPMRRTFSHSVSEPKPVGSCAGPRRRTFASFKHTQYTNTYPPLRRF